MDIRTMLHDGFEDDASRFSGSDFASERADVVTGAVRQRRRVRAAGAVGVAAVAVLGVGAVAYPTVDETINPAVAPACLPFDYATDWWDPDGDGADFLTGFSQEITLSLSTDGLEIADADGDPEPLLIPVEDRLLDGTTSDDETLNVTLSTGLEVKVSLAWSDEEIRVTFQVDGGTWGAVAVSNPRAGFEALSPEIRYWNYAAGTDDTGHVEVTVIDAATGEEALLVARDPDGSVVVTFPDGTSSEFDQGDDGSVTFAWLGVTTFQILPSSTNVTMDVGDEVSADVDAQVIGPEYCLPAWPSESPSATGASSLSDE